MSEFVTTELGTEIDVAFLRRELPEQFIELCKYQQDIITQYEEFIEKLLHMTIQEKVKVHDDPFAIEEVVFRTVDIPATRLIARSSPACRREWEWLKHTTPRVSPDYFISMAYKEHLEKNVKTD